VAEPFEPLVIWDLEDDPDGNYVHIVVEHGITQDEVWDVVRNPKGAVRVHTASCYSGERELHRLIGTYYDRLTVA